jgi:hypothetical protein
MAMSDAEHVGRPARLAAWASLTVGAAGVLLFGSVVGGVGDWVEGRQLQTVAPWAIPGLMLAAVASLMAVLALLKNKGHQLAVILGLAAGFSVLLWFLTNPLIAPPVP